MRSMRPWAAEARADLAASAGAFRLGLTGGLAAWPALVGRVAFWGVCLMVLSAFWAKVGAARLPHTLAERLPREGLGAYIGVTEWITISVAAVQLKLEEEVTTGAVEARLLRPRSWILMVTAEALGASAARLGAIGLGALALLAAWGQGPGPAAIAQAAVLGVGGTTIGVLLYVLVGLSAFWLRRILPVMLIMQKLMFLLGGLFAPISLYRGWFHALAVASPFAAHLGFAGQAVIAPSWPGLAGALAAQALWALFLCALIAFVCRAGVAKALREGAG